MNLKELRQKKGITQVDMARALGISYQTYRGYESGYYKAMSEDKEAKVSKILGVKFRYDRGVQ